MSGGGGGGGDWGLVSPVEMVVLVVGIVCLFVCLLEYGSEYEVSPVVGVGLARVSVVVGVGELLG